jgi:hypothetical protein
MISKIRKKSVKKEKSIKSTLKIFGMLLLAIFMIGIIYLSIFLFTPLKMNEYTLSNGKQTIVFQEMVHIGKTNFYETVNTNVIEYKKLGFVYAYEKVQVESKEEAIKLTELIGLSSDTYSIIADIMKVDNQKNHMNHIKEEDINADIKASDLIKLLEEYKEVNKDEDKLEVNIEKELALLKDSSGFSKGLIKVFLRGGLKYAKNNTLKLNSGLLENVILKKRDEKLFEIISDLNADKILIHYGALHFNSFLLNLKEKDINWKIISEKGIKAL